MIGFVVFDLVFLLLIHQVIFNRILFDVYRWKGLHLLDDFLFFVILFLFLLALLLGEISAQSTGHDLRPDISVIAARKLRYALLLHNLKLFVLHLCHSIVVFFLIFGTSVTEFLPILNRFQIVLVDLF